RAALVLVGGGEVEGAIGAVGAVADEGGGGVQRRDGSVGVGQQALEGGLRGEVTDLDGVIAEGVGLAAECVHVGGEGVLLGPHGARGGGMGWAERAGRKVTGERVTAAVRVGRWILPAGRARGRV